MPICNLNCASKVTSYSVWILLASIVSIVKTSELSANFVSFALQYTMEKKRKKVDSANAKQNGEIASYSSQKQRKRGIPANANQVPFYWHILYCIVGSFMDLSMFDWTWLCPKRNIIENSLVLQKLSGLSTGNCDQEKAIQRPRKRTVNFKH